ncbi:hypothetical protein ANTRET_LOCUS6431 [Anthophora retusa]
MKNTNVTAIIKVLIDSEHVKIERWRKEQICTEHYSRRSESSIDIRVSPPLSYVLKLGSVFSTIRVAGYSTFPMYSEGHGNDFEERGRMKNDCTRRRRRRMPSLADSVAPNAVYPPFFLGRGNKEVGPLLKKTESRQYRAGPVDCLRKQ